MTGVLPLFVITDIAFGKIPNTRELPSRRRWLLGGLLVVTTMMFTVHFVSDFESVSSGFHMKGSGVILNERSVTSNTEAKSKLSRSEQRSKLIHHLVNDEDGENKIPDQLPPPHRWPPLQEGVEEHCLYVGDYGLMERLNNSARIFCAGSSPYTVYNSPETEIQATKFENVVMDWRASDDLDSRTHKATDRDSRFVYKPTSTYCSCKESQNSAPSIWTNVVAGDPDEKDSNCQPMPSSLTTDVSIVSRAVLVSRKDNQNSFTQISGILNAWVMMNVVGWSRKTTQLVTFDRALPSAVDELRHAVLGPEKPIIDGEQFQKQVIRFDSMLIAPFEATGVLMNHLYDDQPCFANKMVADFRDVALKSMAVIPRNEKSQPQRCLVTIITQRTRRVWRNEEELLDQMRHDYKDAYKFGECVFQSLNFVNVSIHEQMRVMVDSDIVIGMHSVDMVNVMWTRPGTVVVEIFPKQYFRWEHRNLCQFLGCSWNQYRGGEDIVIPSADPSHTGKYVSYQEWKVFFDPLFRVAIARLEAHIEGM
ncbi:hypothetical protein PF005_g22934 [Phytophthora fragariae]|uniref:Glycosyltransferase 61 catalytic domain-containing protein n=1 Tax=Phytophthora fragariae TaxID=53985 RepID=A0A6A3Q4E9_9STRA|nr:hypothetical protein PF003_g28118 [Phytophthora fragariae]KAE8921244.1 hypothetical protein PF009_g28471 [Phytophthora fragariae]KAE8969141.1 hypothetical protein PF011_g26916 [Phytophthora fragariae]KAE9068143.1 hypothetical protein PF007_g27803 [Phytophthora fragariae]KAE9073133.1 hypothetical protein PF010_g25201 [Phytophthora fragariae]